MIRKYISGLKQSDKDKIRWRSHEVSRIEAFSDAVFAFAVTLLVISLEVPKSSHELLEMMRGFIPFFICFGFIFYIWYLQYRFFRQYGMHDRITLFLNAGLLFLVLFYVYPLKFMVSIAITLGKGEYTVRNEDFAPLMMLYNAGFMGIFALVAFMYYNAYMKRDELGLTAMEVFETKSHFYTHIGAAAVGLITFTISFAGGKYAGFSMVAYALMGVTGIVSGARDKQFRKRFGNITAVEPSLGAE